jgi:hypothetical protein
VSGSTSNNFNNPVQYTVTAEDGSSKTYTVTVRNALNPAKDITSFSIGGVSASVVGSSITLTLPYGTNRSALVATFVSTGAAVKVGSVAQASGLISNNFSNPCSHRDR